MRLRAAIAALMMLAAATSWASVWPLALRLSLENGAPYPDSTAHLEIRIYSVPANGMALVDFDFPNQTVRQGVTTVAITPAEMAVLDPASSNLWLEVRDVGKNLVYPRQQLSALPLARTTPHDVDVLTVDATGMKLDLAPGGVTSDRVRLDGTGRPELVTVDPAVPAGVQPLDAGEVAALVGSLAPADEGKVWYDESDGRLHYWDGSTNVTVGTLPIQSLGTSTDTIQALDEGTAGVSPAWSMAAGIHTLDIPTAATGGVLQGTISNADYAAFGAKLSRSGGALSGLLDMGGMPLQDLPAPVNAGDVARRGYLDTGAALKQDTIGFATIDDTGDAMSGELNMGTTKVTNLAAPTLDADLARKSYVDSGLATKQNTIGYGTVDDGGDAMNGSLDMNTHRILDVGAPGAAGDLANRTYVDGELTSHTHAGTDITTSSTRRFITDTERSNWDTAHGWGSHGAAGYLTSVDWAAPGPIGGTTAASGAFSRVTATPGAAQNGLTVTGHAVQSADLQQWRNNTTLLGSIDATGGVGLTKAGSTVTLKANAATASFTVALPSSGGTNTHVLSTDGSGNTSWVANDVTPPTLAKGILEGMTVGYVSATQVSIGPGYGEINGVAWNKSGVSTHTMTSLGAASAWLYIYVSYAGSTFPNTVVFTDSTTAPAWSDSKIGWYNGNDRLIGAVLNNGASTLRPFKAAGQGRYIWDSMYNILVSGELTADSTFESITTVNALTPVNTKALYLWWTHSDNSGSAGANSIVRSIPIPRFGKGWNHRYQHSDKDWYHVPFSNRNIEYSTQGNDDPNLTIVLHGYQIAL